MKFVITILLSPFFIAGFIWSFGKQGWTNGVALEEVLREYYKGLAEMREEGR